MVSPTELWGVGYGWQTGGSLPKFDGSSLPSRSSRLNTRRTTLYLAFFAATAYLLISSNPFAPPTPDVTHILTHLRILDRIVDYHNGTRAAHGTGYEASARYVEMVIKRHDACDHLERQEFTAPHWRRQGPSQMWAGSVNLTEDHDFAVLHGPSAEVSGVVVWLRDHGCPLVNDVAQLGEDQLLDRVVAIERPSLAFTDGRTKRKCTVHDVVMAAYAKGAKAVIIANRVEDVGLWPFRGVLDVPWFKSDGSMQVLPQIPVITVTWAASQILRYSHTSITTDCEMETFQTFNLLCTWDPPSKTIQESEIETLLIGAHLDSVYGSPGVVDNGSGSAAILEWMLKMQKAGAKANNGPEAQSSIGRALRAQRQTWFAGVPQNRRIVWAWWGAEELGLVGSQFFVNQLSKASRESRETGDVVASLNVDMIASPNGIPRVMDPISTSNDAVVRPSMKIRRHLESGFKEFQETFELAPTGFANSDEWFFLQNGIPTGGVLNGASKIKTEAQREEFGGMAGAAMDPCYHRGCDTFSNVNARLLRLMSNVGFRTAWHLAMKPELKQWLWDGKFD